MVIINMSVKINFTINVLNIYNRFNSLLVYIRDHQLADYSPHSVCRHVLLRNYKIYNIVFRLHFYNKNIFCYCEYGKHI